MGYLARPQPSLHQLTATLRRSLALPAEAEGGYAAVHVRHGDKSSEARGLQAKLREALAESARLKAEHVRLRFKMGASSFVGLPDAMGGEGSALVLGTVLGAQSWPQETSSEA